LLKAYEHIRKNNIPVTDEAQAVESIAHPVIIVPSPETNLKITTPADLEMATQVLGKNPY
jgi:2-C-methyl-D-erythritol 4-phosphate cytidylyltransferase